MHNKQTSPVLRDVLVSSASSKVPLLRVVMDAARRIDPKIRVFAGDSDGGVITRHFADGFVHLPNTLASNVGAIVQLCLDNGIGMIIPTRDGELLFWAEHASVFAAQGIGVVVSDARAIAVSLDKLKFSELSSSQLPIIPAWLQPEGSFPLVVKERFGAGSRSIGLNLDHASARVHAAQLNEPIFQPFIQGVEVSVDAWLDRAHRVKGLVLRRRDQVRNGESVVTTTFRDSNLERSCIAFLESLPLCGPVMLQLIIDADGAPNVIELNARFGGASTASIAAGLDVWFWTLNERFNLANKDAPFQRIAGEIRQIRAPFDFFL
jgi:carbamoyl-phosphate synthase large subunit